MNLDELRAVQVEERKTDSLQPLRESFYADVADFIAELRDERERAAAGVDDPFAATEVRELSDEIETAEEVVEAIYERRVGKVVKRASLAAAGIPTDEEGLTAEEVDLFESLVADIEDNRRNVLDVLAGEDADLAEDPPTGSGRPPSSDDQADGAETRDEGDPAPEPPPEEPVFDAADAVGGEEAPPGSSSTGAPQPTSDDDMTASDHATTTEDRPGPDGPPPSTGPADDGTAAADPTADAETDLERVSVRITQDVGEILGIDDHTYTLAENDVVTLPTANAEPLIERDAAERID